MTCRIDKINALAEVDVYGTFNEKGLAKTIAKLSECHAKLVALMKQRDKKKK